MKINRTLLAAGLSLAAALPVLAHHAFSSEFDEKRPVKLEGKVTKVEWMNPHARFYMDITENGKTTNWEFELGSPNGLMRSGWTRNSIKIGDVIKCSGNLAKDGSNLANARNLTLSDGTVVGAASSGDTGKQ